MAGGADIVRVMSPTVLHVVSTAQRRGAEIFGADLAEWLTGRQWDSTIVAVKASEPEVPLEIEALAGTSVGRIRKLRRRIRGETDVIVAHGSATLPIVALATIGTGTPFVYRSIGDPEYWLTTWSRRTRVRFALRRASAVVALWPGAAESTIAHHRLPRGRVAVIPNAVRQERFTPVTGAERLAARSIWGVPPGQPVAAVVGALTHEKGVDLAIAAAQLFREMFFLVVGGGPERPALEAQALAGGAEVVFTGQLADLRAVYAASDVLVVPSRTEGIPAVAIEAGLCGIPTVGTAVGGVAEVVVDNETGVLVPPESAPELADGIRRVLRDRVSLSIKAARHCQERFTFDVVGPAWERLLLQVAEEQS